MKAFSFLAVFYAAAVAFAVPTVSNVALSQDDSTHIVTISYDLSGASAGIVTLDIFADGMPLPHNCVTALSGCVNRMVEPGNGHIILWRADADWPDRSLPEGSLSARLTVWDPLTPPEYLVVDLVRGGQRVDESAASWTNAVWFYADADSIPYGITNKLYKTERLPLRLVRARDMRFRAGSPTAEPGRGKDDCAESLETTRYVTLSSDFYLGVYEFTEGQWYHLMKEEAAVTSAAPNFPRVAELPVMGVSYNAVRGKKSEGINWPATGHDVVGASSVVAALRGRYGIDFDLPTSAEWEFSCRAATSTGFNNGRDNTSNWGAEEGGPVDEVAFVFQIAQRYYRAVAEHEPDMVIPDDGSQKKWKFGSYSASAFPAPVGLKRPNAFGLYDMHGNAAEWCLDWADAVVGIPSAAVTDPAGLPSTDSGATNRVLRGGCVLWSSPSARSAAMHTSKPSESPAGAGFRLRVPVSLVNP